jgi:hypothetical protein
MNNPLYDDSLFLNAVKRKMMTGDELASVAELISDLPNVGMFFELVKSGPYLLMISR